MTDKIKLLLLLCLFAISCAAESFINTIDTTSADESSTNTDTTSADGSSTNTDTTSADGSSTNTDTTSADGSSTNTNTTSADGSSTNTNTTSADGSSTSTGTTSADGSTTTTTGTSDGSSTATCTNDYLEPNDIFADATPLTESLNGTICPDDIDIFSITIPAEELVNIELTFTHDDGDLDLELYNEVGTRINFSITVTDNEEITVSPYPQERLLFIRVLGYSSAINSYEISLTSTTETNGSSTSTGTTSADGSTTTTTGTSDGSSTATCTNDYLEPNDIFADATPLTESLNGTICPDDIDIFSITIPAEELVNIELTFTHDDGDLELELYNEVGTRINFSITVTDNEEITVSPYPQERLLFIRVLGYSSAINSYEISLTSTTETICEEDLFEPNNQIELATVLPYYSTLNVSICPQDIDFYSLAVLPDQSIDINIIFQHDNGDLDAYLLDSTGENLITVSNTEDDNEIITINSDPQERNLKLLVVGYENDTNSYEISQTTDATCDDTFSALLDKTEYIYGENINVFGKGYLDNILTFNIQNPNGDSVSGGSIPPNSSNCTFHFTFMSLSNTFIEGTYTLNVSTLDTNSDLQEIIIPFYLSETTTGTSDGSTTTTTGASDGSTTTTTGASDGSTTTTTGTSDGSTTTTTGTSDGSTTTTGSTGSAGCDSNFSVYSNQISFTYGENLSVSGIGYAGKSVEISVRNSNNIAIFQVYTTADTTDCSFTYDFPAFSVSQTLEEGTYTVFAFTQETSTSQSETATSNFTFLSTNSSSSTGGSTSTTSTSSSTDGNTSTTSGSSSTGGGNTNSCSSGYTANLDNTAYTYSPSTSNKNSVYVSGTASLGSSIQFIARHENGNISSIGQFFVSEDCTFNEKLVTFPTSSNPNYLEGDYTITLTKTDVNGGAETMTLDYTLSL